mmetsp:Transcript_28895/g.40293  ORF Transcript_28895/g.40293 Transcript_28895/m.40293 type:complete len:127 (+) Transcript_28895:592-972(+)
MEPVAATQMTNGLIDCDLADALASMYREDLPREPEEVSQLVPRRKANLGRAPSPPQGVKIEEMGAVQQKGENERIVNYGCVIGHSDNAYAIVSVHNRILELGFAAICAYIKEESQIAHRCHNGGCG